MDNASAKLAAGKWAMNVMTGGDAVILDSETTGTNRFGNDEPVQVGMIDLHGNILMDCLLKPQRPLQPDVIAIHGITNEMVATAPSFRDRYGEISRLLANKPCIIYNAKFDTGILKSACRLYSLQSIRVHDQCAMLQFAAFKGEWNDYHKEWKWQTLDAALRHFNLTVDAAAHSAVGDCIRTLAVIKAMAAWYHQEVVVKHV